MVFFQAFCEAPLPPKRGVQVKNGILFPAEFVANKTASIWEWHHRVKWGSVIVRQGWRWRSHTICEVALVWLNSVNWCHCSTLSNKREKTGSAMMESVVLLLAWELTFACVLLHSEDCRWCLWSFGWTMAVVGGAEQVKHWRMSHRKLWWRYVYSPP